MAGFFVQCCHKIVWVFYVMIMCVDNALFWQAIAALDMSACLILSFYQTFNYPISWRKLQLGPTIQYIVANTLSGRSVPATPNKGRKAVAGCPEGFTSPCSCEDLKVLIGLLHWVLQLAPSLRPWLCTLYHDKARPFSLTQAVWQQLTTLMRKCILHVASQGQVSGLESRLLSVRHVPINTLDDLRLVRNITSVRFLQFWQTWCLRPQVFRPLALSPLNPLVSLAVDACASLDKIGIGVGSRLRVSPHLVCRILPGFRFHIIGAPNEGGGKPRHCLL